jgi:hypothetical protein
VTPQAATVRFNELAATWWRPTETMAFKHSPVTWGALLLICACVAACGSTRHGTEKPWGPLPTTAPPHLSAKARAGIDQTLDAFVRYGVERQAPARAYALASPMMKSGVTHHQWLAGTLPVPPYQSKGTNFHRYSVMGVEPNQAYLTLILQPRHPRSQGAIAYNIRVTRRQGHWLVDWFTPTAFFGTKSHPSVFAQPDLGPGGGADLLAPKHHANLIMLGVLSVLGLPLLAGFGYGAWSLVGGRFRRRTPLPEDERWDAALRQTGR